MTYAQTSERPAPTLLNNRHIWVTIQPTFSETYFRRQTKLFSSPLSIKRNSVTSSNVDVHATYIFSKTIFHGINFMIHWCFYLLIPYCYVQFTKLLGESQMVAALDFTGDIEKAYTAVSDAPVPQGCSFWSHQTNVLLVIKYCLEIFSVLRARIWKSRCISQREGRISFTGCNRSIQYLQDRKSFHWTLCNINKNHCMWLF